MASFQVRVNATFSDDYPIYASVAQGSVLGPILFSLYMADLPIPFPGHLALHADDAAIYLQACNRNHLVSKLQKLMPAVENWHAKWKFKINVSKEKAIIISRANKRNPPRKLHYARNLYYGERISNISALSWIRH